MTQDSYLGVVFVAWVQEGGSPSHVLFSWMNKVILWDFGGLTYKPLNKARLLVVGWFRFPGFCRLTLESRFTGWLGTRFSALGTSGLGHSRMGGLGPKTSCPSGQMRTKSFFLTLFSWNRCLTKLGYLWLGVWLAAINSKGFMARLREPLSGRNNLQVQQRFLAKICDGGSILNWLIGTHLLEGG